MGNGCTKNIQVLNRNSVAPNEATKPSTSHFTIRHVEPIKISVTQSATSQPNFTDDIPTTSTNRNSHTISAFQTPNHSAKTDLWNINSSSNHQNENTDITSIIFDKIESNSVKPCIVRSISIDSQSDRSAKSAEIRANRFSIAPLHRLFKSNQNLATTTEKPANKSENTQKFYHRFSTSMQSLFSGNLNKNRKRNLSASDTSINKRFAMSQQQLIDNDYCPSVLFNRKARKSNNIKNTTDKSQNFYRWPNQLWQKFVRKRNDPKARKS